jgi:hypothetical protein
MTKPIRAHEGHSPETDQVLPHPRFPRAFKLCAAKGASKILVAGLFRKHSSAGNRWLARRLAMGHTSSVIRLEGAFSKGNASCGKLSVKRQA